MNKNKVLHLNSAFSVKAADGEQSIYIEGYASTKDVDRHGDIVPTTVWEKGMSNYLKNPVILAYHDHSNPIGRMVEYKTDGNGLWIKARISTAAKQFQLIKDGILTAFSIGFRVIDAEYNSAAEVFLIKDLELVEISVVSVPANQNTLFDLSKAFDTPDEYKRYKEQFAPQSQSAKGLESATEAKRATTKEWNMNPEDIKQMLADAAKAAAEEATKALETRQKAEQEAKAQEAARQADIEARVKAAVEARIETGKSGAEKLLEEVEARFAKQSEEQKSVLAGLESALKEKAAELEAIQKSKMTFANNKSGEISYEDKEKAVLLAKMSNKAIHETRFGRNLIEKTGAHQPTDSTTFETEVSLQMENEVRRRLVVAPTLRAIQMQTNVMSIPINPEAGVATWVQNSAFGSDASTTPYTESAGNKATHQLKEITLNAYKVATNEYVAFEEEEDSLIAIMPVIRDAMVRRVARAVDRAFLRGANTATDPVNGIATRAIAGGADLITEVDISDNAKMTVAILRAMRRDLGTWGLDPADVVYIVDNDSYYDLLDDETFLTVDKVGDRATLLTGQIGSVGNSPVLVSGEFAGKDAAQVGAVAYARSNFLVGNQRGLRVDTQDLVETQRRVMVASLRTGLTQVTNNYGVGASVMRYKA